MLDFLNTVAVLNGAMHDFLQTDDDVLHWLRSTGLLDAAASAASRREGELVAAANRLRQCLRTVVEAKKKGSNLRFAALNDFLREGSSHLELSRMKSGELRSDRRFDSRTAVQVLTPLAELAAEFLATVDFDLVKHCEGEGCVLWFYDLTKSHRRRWCSMEVCGNRHKVAAFRARQQE